MNRRAGSILLILAMLGQVPCRATESAAAARARVRAEASDPARVDALRRAALAAGARVRVLPAGDGVLLEVSAVTASQLRRALEAMGRQANAAGVKVRVTLAAPIEEAKAVAAGSVSIDPPRRAGACAATVEAACGTGSPAAAWPEAVLSDVPACCPAACVCGWGLRGPPA